METAAVFGGVITAPRTVTVDIPVSVGQIFFNNANAYTIAGSNTISLDAMSGVAQINVTSGSHTISAPVHVGRQHGVGRVLARPATSRSRADRIQHRSEPDQGGRRRPDA